MMTRETALLIATAAVRNRLRELDLPPRQADITSAAEIVKHAVQYSRTEEINRLVFHYDGDVESVFAGTHKCTCERFTRKRILCDHIIAAMIDVEAEQIVRHTGNEASIVLGRLFDLAASQDALDNKASVSLTIDLADRSEPVSISIWSHDDKKLGAYRWGTDLEAMSSQVADEFHAAALAKRDAERAEQIVAEEHEGYVRGADMTMHGVISYPLDTMLPEDEHVAPELASGEYDGD